MLHLLPMCPLPLQNRLVFPRKYGPCNKVAKGIQGGSYICIHVCDTQSHKQEVLIKTLESNSIIHCTSDGSPSL